MSDQGAPSHSLQLGDHMNVSQATQQHINQHSHSLSLSKGQLAIHKGDSVAGAYIVTSGQLRVFSYSSRGSEATLYILNPGETCVFALNSLFKNLRYPAWVAAEQDTELLVISGNAYKELFRKDPGIQDLTLNALSTAVYQLMQEVEQLQGWNLKQRLINYLLNISNADGVVSLTQQQISNHLGTSREVTARLLGELSTDKLITTGRGRIVLNDSRGLSRHLTP
ncbi:Crp/Fnr family transcriptional regulator [Pseudoteredinibacter isoporae]|uniref:Crp/Fnr family transcriptional regulator n=1 Tax=Pseudoteredinibacter isoporae TaxID=570281 RepID=UPI00310A90CA